MQTVSQRLVLQEDIRALDDRIEQLLTAASARTTDKPNPNTSIAKLPKLAAPDTFTQPYVAQYQGVARADSTRLLPQETKQVNEIRKVEDPIQAKLDKAKSLKATAGAQWYNLPKTTMTPELKKDLRLLHMRNVLDPKQHFKSQSKKFRIPDFSHVGTVIQGPTEFFSARMTKKDRTQSLTAGLLADKKSGNRFKSKYSELQKVKTSGRKAFYKKQQAKRKKS